MRNAVPGKTIALPARRRGGLMLAALLCGSVVSGAATTAAWATVAEDDLVDVSGLAQVSDGELSELRGGFDLGPWRIDFGLMIKTAINNVEVLQTTFNIPAVGEISGIRYHFLHDGAPPGGGDQEPMPSAVPGGSAPSAIPPVVEANAQGAIGQVGSAVQDVVPETPPAQPPQSFDNLDSAVQSVAQSGSASPNATPSPSSNSSDPRPDADGSVDLPPADTFTVAEFADGIVISNGMGTEIIQQVTGGVLTQIVNQANGIAISHTTEMNLFVNNFSQVVSQAAARSAFDALAMQSVLNNPLLGQ